MAAPEEGQRCQEWRVQHDHQPRTAVRDPVAHHEQMLCERAGYASRAAAKHHWRHSGSPCGGRAHVQAETPDRPQPEGEGPHEQQQQHHAGRVPTASHNTRSSPLSSPPTSIGISNGGTAGGAPLSAAAGGGGRTDSAAAVATGRCMEGQGGGSGGSGAHGPLMVDEVEEAALVRRGRHKGIICVFKGCDKYARLSKQGVRRYCIHHMRKLGITPKKYVAPRGRVHGRTAQEDDYDEEEEATPPTPTPPPPPLHQQQEPQRVQQAPQGLHGSPRERLASCQHLQRHVDLAHAAGGAGSSANPYGWGGSRPVGMTHVDNGPGRSHEAEAELMGRRAAGYIVGGRGPVIPLGTGVGVAAAMAAAARREADCDDVFRAAQGLRALVHGSRVSRRSASAAGGEDAAAAWRAHLAVDAAGLGLPPLQGANGASLRGTNSEMEGAIEVEMEDGGTTLSVRQRLQQQLMRLLSGSAGVTQRRGGDEYEAAAGAAVPAAEALMAALAAARGGCREAAAGSAGVALRSSMPGGQASGNTRGHVAVGCGAAAIPAPHDGLVLDRGALGQLQARGVLPVDVRAVAVGGLSDPQQLAPSVPAAAAAGFVNRPAGLGCVLLDPDLPAPGQAGRQATATRPLLHRSGPGGEGRLPAQEVGQWGRRPSVGRDPRAGRQLAPLQLDLSRQQGCLTAWGLEQEPAGTREDGMGTPGTQHEPPRLRHLAKTAALLQERFDLGTDTAGVPLMGSGCEVARVAAAAPTAVVAAEGGRGAAWERPNDRGAQPGFDVDVHPGRQQLHYELQRRCLLQQLQQMQQPDMREQQEHHGHTERLGRTEQPPEQLPPGALADSVSDGAVLVSVRADLAAELLEQCGHKMALGGGSNQTVLLLLRTAGAQASVGVAAGPMEREAPATAAGPPAPPPPQQQQQQRQEQQDRAAFQRSYARSFGMDLEIGMSDFHVLGSGPANDDGAGCVCIGGGGSTAAGLDGGFGGAVAEGARGCGQRAGVRQAAAVRVAGGGQADRCWAADGAGADQVVPDAPSPAAAQPREVGSGSSVPPLRMPLLPSRSLGRSGLSGGWMAPWTAPPQQQQAAEGPLAAVRQQSCYMDVFDTDTAGAGSALGAQLGPRPSHKDSPLTYVTPLAIPDPALGNEEELSLRGLGAGELWKAPASDACISPVAQAGGSEGARGEPSVPRQQQQQHPQQPVLSSVSRRLSSTTLLSSREEQAEGPRLGRLSSAELVAPAQPLLPEHVRGQQQEQPPRKTQQALPRTKQAGLDDQEATQNESGQLSDSEQPPAKRQRQQQRGADPGEDDAQADTGNGVCRTGAGALAQSAKPPAPRAAPGPAAAPPLVAARAAQQRAVRPAAPEPHAAEQALMGDVQIKEEPMDEARSGCGAEASRPAPPQEGRQRQQQQPGTLTRRDGARHDAGVQPVPEIIYATAPTRPSGGMGSLAAAVAQAEAAEVARLKRPPCEGAPPSLPPAKATVRAPGSQHDAGVGLASEPSHCRQQQEREQQPSPLPAASEGMVAAAAAVAAGVSGTCNSAPPAAVVQVLPVRAPAAANASAFATGTNAPPDTSAGRAEQHAAVGAKVPPLTLRITDVQVARLGEVLAAIEAACRAGGRMPIVLLQTVGQGGSGGGGGAGIGTPLPPPPAAGNVRALYQLSDGSLRLGGEFQEELLGDGGGGRHAVTLPAQWQEQQQQRKRRQKLQSADAGNAEGGVGSGGVTKGAGIATEPCGAAAGEDALGTAARDGRPAAVPIAAEADAHGAGCDAPSKGGDSAAAAEVRQAAPAPGVGCSQPAMMTQQRLHEASQPQLQQPQQQQQQQPEVAVAQPQTSALKSLGAHGPLPGTRLDWRPNNPAVPPLAGGRGDGGAPPVGPERGSINPSPAAPPAGRTAPSSGAAAGALTHPSVLVAEDGNAGIRSAPQSQQRDRVPQRTAGAPARPPSCVGGSGSGVGGGGRAAAACGPGPGRGGPVVAAGGTTGGGPGPYITICVPPAAAEVLLREAAARAAAGGGQQNPLRGPGVGSGGSVCAARAVLAPHRMAPPGRQADCAAPPGTAAPGGQPRGGWEAGPGNSPQCTTGGTVGDGGNGVCATRSAGTGSRLAPAGAARSGSTPSRVPHGVPLVQPQPPREPPPQVQPLLQPQSSPPLQQHAASCHSVDSGTHTLGDVVTSGSDVSNGSGGVDGSGSGGRDGGGGGGGGASEAHSPQRKPHLTRAEAA